MSNFDPKEYPTVIPNSSYLFNIAVTCILPINFVEIYRCPETSQCSGWFSPLLPLLFGQFRFQIWTEAGSKTGGQWISLDPAGGDFEKPPNGRSGVIGFGKKEVEEGVVLPETPECQNILNRIDY